MPISIPRLLGSPKIRNGHPIPVRMRTAGPLGSSNDMFSPDSKTVHDPCPAGWRVPTQNELQVLISRNSSDWNTILSNSEKNGGVLLKYDNTANGTYLRFSGYPADLTTLNNVGYTTFLAITASNAKMSSVFVASRSGGIVEGGGGLKFVGKDNRDAQNIRCIQE